VKVRKFGKNIVLSCSSLHLCRDASGVSRVKVEKFGKNIVIPDGSLRQSSRKDQWNCYCDLQASLHQMCVMRWANGAILLKRLVHLSNTEHLVVLAEKKSLWTVSVREPNLGVPSIPFSLGFLWSLTISMC
jgi:hypothetical protein